MGNVSTELIVIFYRLLVSLLCCMYNIPFSSSTIHTAIMSSIDTNLLPTLDQLFELSSKSSAKLFKNLKQCIDRANKMLRATNSKRQNSFVLTVLVPLFENVGNAMAVDGSAFQDKAQCHDILLTFITKLGVIKVEVGGAGEFAQVDVENGTITFNILWIGSADGCKDRDVVGYHKALCLTKLFHCFANLLTPQIMQWMHNKQGEMNPAPEDLRTPNEIGTRLAVTEEAVTMKVSPLPTNLDPPGPGAPHKCIPALKRKFVTVGDMGLGMEEILLGGYRLDFKPEDKEKWHPKSVIFTTTDRRDYELPPMQLNTWVTHVLNAPLSRRSTIEDFAEWYAPPRPTLETARPKRKAIAASTQRKRVSASCDEIPKEEEEVLIIDECEDLDEDGQPYYSNIPYDSCPPSGRKV